MDIYRGHYEIIITKGKTGSFYKGVTYKGIPIANVFLSSWRIKQDPEKKTLIDFGEKYAYIDISTMKYCDVITYGTEQTIIGNWQKGGVLGAYGGTLYISNKSKLRSVDLSKDDITIGDVAKISKFNNINASDLKKDIKIDGNNEKNFIVDGAGNDTIYGKGGNDTIFSSKGRNAIDGGDGNDYIMSEAGHSTIKSESGNDTISMLGLELDVDGGAGNDLLQYTISEKTTKLTVDLSKADQTVNDKINISNFENVLLTTTNKNFIGYMIGDSKDNILAADGGTTYMTGGVGADKFITFSGHIIINDLNVTQGDNLNFVSEFGGLCFLEMKNGEWGLKSKDDCLILILKKASQKGKDLFISGDEDNDITIKNMNWDSLKDCITFDSYIG